MKSFVLRSIVAFGLAGICASAGANVVSGNVSGINPDNGAARGFELWSTPPTAVGINNIDTDNWLFAFNEKQNVYFGNAPQPGLEWSAISPTQKVSSHYVVFDPKNPQELVGSVTFDGRILGLYIATSGLEASQPYFGLPSVNYQYVPLTGLEDPGFRRAQNIQDVVSVKGNTLYLDWQAFTPGDHIRVITAIPEPGSYAMFLAGLGMLGAVMRHRKTTRI